MQVNSCDVVVLGAGFGGLSFCQAFRHPRARVTVVDRQNHHLFQPLLYQVATAGLSATEIAQPIRAILRDQPGTTVLMDSVVDVRLAQREVVLAEQTLRYDYLVIALGGVTSYFGHCEWETYAPGLKSIDDALRIRRQILLAFERAETHKDAAARRRSMTIVIVGGGPTGVELAGACAELARHVLRRDFRRTDPAQARVVLIEAAPRVLGHLPEELSSKAQAQLEALGVEVRCGCGVRSIVEGKLELEDGAVIESASIIWAAGVAANPILRKLGLALDRGGRVEVGPDLSVPGHPEVFAIGDNALVNRGNGRPVPGVSPVAIQEARHVARLIEAELSSPLLEPTQRPPFRYRDRGTMATIGRSAAVALIGRRQFSGFPAWILWLVIHLLFLIGFRNKLAVLLQWGYSYLTYGRGARIIIGVPTRDSEALRQVSPRSTG